MRVQEQFADNSQRPFPAGWAKPRPAARGRRRAAWRFFSASPGGRIRGHIILKRLLDLAVAIPALVVVSPILAAFAILIRLESSGPVFFRQRRNGLHGQPFEILKLRTMTVLDNGEQIVQASRNDARTTRVGRWLRASSLDELPQLINVIKGEMSLVGPRPHACAHDRHYATLIADYKRRHDVKPGITGWAQVNGARGATPTVELMRHRIALDAWYAKNASVLLDLQILLRTPVEILRGRNAY